MESSSEDDREWSSFSGFSSSGDDDDYEAEPNLRGEHDGENNVDDDITGQKDSSQLESMSQEARLSREFSWTWARIERWAASFCEKA